MLAHNIVVLNNWALISTYSVSECAESTLTWCDSFLFVASVTFTQKQSPLWCIMQEKDLLAKSKIAEGQISLCICAVW